MLQYTGHGVGVLFAHKGKPASLDFSGWGGIKLLSVVFSRSLDTFKVNVEL